MTTLYLLIYIKFSS